MDRCHTPVMENEHDETDAWTALADLEFNCRLRNLLELLMAVPSKTEEPAAIDAGAEGRDQ